MSEKEEKERLKIKKGENFSGKKERFGSKGKWKKERLGRDFARYPHARGHARAKDNLRKAVTRDLAQCMYARGHVHAMNSQKSRN